jgi:hypothetical protein
MLTAAVVAQQLGISARAVYDLAACGMLACHRLGVGRGAVRFDPADVEAYRLANAPAETTAPVAPPMLPAAVLRKYLRMKQAAEQDGSKHVPELTASQMALAELRYRRLQMAPWANAAAIAEMYSTAKQLTQETGVLHHVDHVIPLLGEFVSGLHVESNLQVLPADENIRKRNRYSP